MPRPIHPARTAAAARGMTLSELAAEVGVSPGFLRAVLSDRMPSSVGLRERVAKALGYNEAEVFPERQATIR